MQALLERPAQGEYGVRQIEVRQRTMGDAAAARGDRCHVVLANEIAVGEDRVARQQAEAVEACRVGATEAIEHMGVRPVAFRAMGLDVAALVRRQPP